MIIAICNQGCNQKAIHHCDVRLPIYIVFLPPLQPRGKHIGVKFQWLVEWPFSLLRWLTVPHCYHVSALQLLAC